MSEDSEKKISSSPDRNTFQLEGARKRAAEDGKEVPEFYENFWKTAKEQDEANLKDLEWQRNNLEYDLRSTEWICDKAKANNDYAQNIYASLCNNDFLKLEVVPILKNDTWSCSWRYSGGIVADMRGEGDYIDWYCSGIGNSDDGYGLDHRQATGYVSEGIVTDEIREDFKKLGWIVVEQKEE
jgi:hypothetical protein